MSGFESVTEALTSKRKVGDGVSDFSSRSLGRSSSPLVTNLGQNSKSIEGGISALTEQSAPSGNPDNPIVQGGSPDTPKRNGKGLTPGQQAAVSIAGTVLETAGSIYDTKQREQDQLNDMQDRFDLEFGSREFDAQRSKMIQEQNQINDIFAILENIDQQSRGASSQTLSNQKQIFIRNPT